MRTPSAPVDLASMVQHWVETGIISTEQAERIRADVATPAAAPLPTPGTVRGASLVTEAMGYLGGVIVMVGLGLVTGWFWNDLSTAVRVGLAAVVAALMLIAGAVVPSGLAAVGVRLRSVLWVGSAVATFAGLSLLAADGFGWDGNEVVLFASGITTVVSAAMWAAHHRLLQHATVFATLAVTAGSAAALTTDSYLAPMTAVWATGAAWFLLAWFDIVQSRRAGMTLGAIATIVGSMSLEGEGWGTVVALATVAALVAVAVAIRDLLLLAVSSLGTLAVLPAVIVRYFPGVLSAALALIIVGLLLVGAAVFTARHRRPRPPALRPS